MGHHVHVTVHQRPAVEHAAVHGTRAEEEGDRQQQQEASGAQTRVAFKAVIGNCLSGVLKDKRIVLVDKHGLLLNAREQARGWVSLEGMGT